MNCKNIAARTMLNFFTQFSLSQFLGAGEFKDLEPNEMQQHPAIYTEEIKSSLLLYFNTEPKHVLVKALKVS